MDDLRDRFSTLDRVPVPDVWSDVERRLASLRTVPTTRLAVVAREPRQAIARPSAAARTWLAGRRTAWVLVAAMITILLVGGAFAAGSGLVRLTSVSPTPVPPTATLIPS